MTTATRRPIDFTFMRYDPVTKASEMVRQDVTTVSVSAVDRQDVRIEATYIEPLVNLSPFISLRVESYLPDRGDGYAIAHTASTFLSIEQAEQMIATLRAAVAVAKNQA